MSDTCRILVTGGAGFIGSNLVDELVKSYQVVVIDDLSTGTLDNLNQSKDKIKFIEGKIEEFDLNSLGSVDGMVHLAAQASVPLSIEDFKNSSKSNIQGAINVIEYCSSNKVPLVYASSSAIYGNLPLGDDLRDNVDLLSPYAVDKLAMELYAKCAFNVYGLSSVGLRFFNVYGPRQDPKSPYSGVISIFVDRLLRGLPITINGGYQTRDFVYVKDVVKCIIASLHLVTDQKVCKFLNVLTGVSITIDKLAELIANEVGVEAEKNYQDLLYGDPAVSQGTAEQLIQSLLVDLNEFTDVKVGLRDTINFIKHSD